MHVRLPRAVLALGFAAAAFGAATCAQVPDNAVFACEEGSCPSPLVCSGGFCVNPTCEPLTCNGLGKNCGTLSDGCGNELDCGRCSEPETCGANVPNVCSCAATPTAAMCADAGFTCGRHEMTDVCGTDRQVECGGCGGGAVCFEGQCCAPKTQAELCAARNYDCGTHAVYNCGVATQINCGTCGAGTQCISRNTAEGEEDSEARCSSTCVAETNEEFCNRTGIHCGIAPTAPDNCNTPRSNVNCTSPTSTCPDGRACPADGGNRCECATLLQNCSTSDQCCAGSTCGTNGLCCVPSGQACNDGAECCVGDCVLGFCQ